MRNGWNLIDIVGIIAGFIEFIINAKSSIILRSLRIVLRPLKLINAVGGMKKLIQSLIEALPDFANVGVFLLFVFTLFATMGL
jgi:Ion transport protein